MLQTFHYKISLAFPLVEFPPFKPEDPRQVALHLTTALEPLVPTISTVVQLESLSHNRPSKKGHVQTLSKEFE